MDSTKSTPTLRTPDGQPFDVPADGSLGLLALGYVGIMLWRKKRREVADQTTQPPHNPTIDEKA